MDGSRRHLLKLGTAVGALTGLLSRGATQALAEPKPAQQSQPPKWAAGVDPGQTLPPEAENGPWRHLRAVKEKKVIDFDCHAYETPVQGHTYKDEAEQHKLGKYQDFTEDLIASMDKHGIAQVCLYPSLVPYETVRDTSFKKYPQRFIRTATLPTQTTRGKELTPELLAQAFKEQLENDGCKVIGSGGSIANLLKKYSPRDLKPVIDVILEHEAPVEFHTGWTATGAAMGYGRGYASVSEWVESAGKLLGACPELTIILQNGGGSLEYPDGHEAIRLLFSFDNAYLDTGKTTPNVVTEAVRGVGPERMLFATDWNRPTLKEYGPFNHRAVYQHWWGLNTIANADITEDQRDWVLHKSARKLLKLPS